MLIFVKLGGSLITDKHKESSFHHALVERLAREIRLSVEARPDLQLLIGHGSGAFGHFVARRYDTMSGVYTGDQWRGFAHVATVAAELNYLVARALSSEGLPVWRIQPSASLVCQDGTIQHMALDPFQQALKHDLIPLLYGDVALDSVRGGTIISTEKLFTYLAQALPVRRILLMGDVDGVYGDGGQVISEITPANYESVAHFIAGAAGADVTGGMSAKVKDMLDLVQVQPHITIDILNGTQPDLLRQALTGESVRIGTTIRN